MSTCITNVAVAPSDILLRPFLNSSCIITHSYPTSFSLPLAPKQIPYFRIFSLSTQPQPQGTTAPVTTTTTTARKSVAIYLMERLGFSEEDSLAISKKLLNERKDPRTNQVSDLIYFEKADNVISYLQDENECGFDLSQIKHIVSKYPRILTADVDKTIKPKIKLLQDVGFSTSELALVLSANPKLYLESYLSPVIQALRDIMGSDEEVVKVFKGLNYGTSSNMITNLIPNAAMLENECGIPRDRIRKFLSQQPKAFIILKTESLRAAVVKIQDKWGINRDSAMFLRAVHVFCGLSDENMNSKFQVFRTYGWSESDILLLIRKLPNCLLHAESRIKMMLEFYMNELKYDPAYVASRPSLLGFSLDNRVVPRGRILSILKAKELIKADFQLYSALTLTEDKFYNRFIFPYEKDVPELRDVYAKG